ncbi:MAG TPA: DUF4846 domain-containing protein [Polyangiaceae bacterium]|nr:DUF4846 domain-containing protein [Polyangiaceae bacterium]
MHRIAVFSLIVAAFGCKHEPKVDTVAPPKSSVTASALATAVGTAPSSNSATPVEGGAGSAALPDADAGKRAGAAVPDAQRYRWLSADSHLTYPAPLDSLEARFPTPPGYQRVTLAPSSFGAWLRGLPLAAPGTPVVNNSGGTVFPGDDAYVAAVIAIDVGAGDLQQSSDAVIRLHGEWLWANDQPNAISYKSTTKLDMPFSRWAKGQRLLAAGPNMGWVVKSKPKEPTYNDFRQYIDAVMLWSNNVSLAMRASHVSDPTELTAGDFFLQTRGKGHAVLVLDVAQKPTGERVALLGQALQSPAQSMHVMRLGQATAWFSLRPPNPLLTPRGDEFSWADLSRLEPKKDE